MNKNDSIQTPEIPAFLKVALNFGIKKPTVTYPKIELDLLVKTTLAMRCSVDPTLDQSAAREEYKKIAHEAVLLIEGCQQILSARASMQAILDEKAAKEERERLPRTVSWADGIYAIVGDRNSGPERGGRKLGEFLSAFYGDFLLSEDSLPSCEEWVNTRMEFWRQNRFNEEEVDIFRDKRNDYINRGILNGNPVMPKIVEKSSCLAPSDSTAKMSDAIGKVADKNMDKARRKAK